MMTKSNFRILRPIFITVAIAAAATVSGCQSKAPPSTPQAAQAPTPPAVGASASSGATSITVNSSAGVQRGDVIFCYVGTHDNAANITVTTPTGWTLIAGPLNPTTGIESYLFQHISDGTDGASYTFNFSGGPYYGSYASQITYHGVNNATPVDGNVTTASPTSVTTSIVLPAVSPVGSSDLLVAFVADYEFLGTPAITGMTEEGFFNSIDAIFDQQLTSSGSTGTRTVTGGSSSFWAGFLFAVTPSRGVIQPRDHGRVDTGFDRLFYR